MEQKKAFTLPPVDRSLPIALLHARESIMVPIREMLARAGVTEPQWRILRVLSEHSPLMASAVAMQAAISFPSLTRTVTLMRKRGLISQNQDKRDRRCQLLQITPEGQDVINRNLEQAMKIAESFEARLGTDDYMQLLCLLARLAGNRD